MPINAKPEKLFFFGIGLAAIFFYSYIIYTHAINMPKWDDFPDILQFVDRWLLADTFSEKLAVFFYHTNEHILLVNHLIILAQYYLCGHLDFRWLIYLGNLFFLGSALLLWLPFRQQATSAFVFALLMLTLVTFYPYESTLWAMTAISNQAVIFFSLLTLWYGTQPSPSMIRIIPLTLLAIFSQSNGFFLLPLLAVLFFFHHRQKLAAWLAFSVIIVTAYLMVLDPASQQQAPRLWGDIPLHHYLLTIPGLIASFGSVFFSGASLPAFISAFVLGALILALSLKPLLNRHHSPFILYSLLFFVLCMASIIFYRGLVGGPSIIFTSRYKMYGAAFLTLGFLLNPQWLVRCQSSPLARYGTLAFGVLFFSASFYWNLPKSRLIDGDLRDSLVRWVEDGDFRRGRGYFIKDSDSYLFKALHQGTWSPLALIDPEQIIHDITLLDTCPDASMSPVPEDIPRFQIKHINRNAPGIRLEILSPPSALSPPTIAKPWEIYLCSPDTHYRLRFMTQQDAQGAYPVYYIPAAEIAPGHYSLGMQYHNQAFMSGETLLRKPHIR